MKIHLGIDELLSRKLTGTLTGDEQEALQRWINASPENKREYERMESIRHSRLSVPTYIHARELGKKIWQEGTGKTTSRTKQLKTRRYHPTFLKVAATLTVILTAAAIVYFFIGQRPILTSGRQAGISSVVRKSNPSGQKSRIILPDKTVVWLNAESELHYPEQFSESRRTVTLSGEAFFEVSKDSLHPFRVRVGDLTVTALGTQFNINSFAPETEIDVALIEGRVKIESEAFDGDSILLSPGEGITCRKDNLSIRTYRFNHLDAGTITGWKDGMLIFDGSDFEEFLSSIRRWYGVEITVQGTPDEVWNLRGAYQDEYLTNVLESISYKKNFTYELTDKSLTIKF